MGREVEGGGWRALETDWQWVNRLIREGMFQEEDRMEHIKWLRERRVMNRKIFDREKGVEG